MREQLCCLHNVRSRKKRNRIPEKLKKKENENLLLTNYRVIQLKGKLTKLLETRISELLYSSVPLAETDAIDSIGSLAVS